MSDHKPDADLSDFKAAVSALETDAVPYGANRFGLLRQVMKLGMKFATTGGGDPAIWRILGELELARHEKFTHRSIMTGGTDSPFQWDPQVGASFDRAAEYLSRAAEAGDERATRCLGHLYYGSYSPPSLPFSKYSRPDATARTRPSKALHYFRKALAMGSTDALYDIYRVLSRRPHNKLAVPYLRQACRYGHAGALVELAMLTHRGDGVAQDDVECMRLLEDANHFYQLDKKDDVLLQSRMDFLHGVCLYNGAGAKPDRDGGLDLIRRAADSHYEAREWLKEYEKKGGDTSGSPMRFFTLSYKMKGQIACLEKDDAELLAPLEALIGMPAIKDDIGRLVNIGKMQALRRINGLKPVPLSMHMAFLGAPGTGKTTVARLVGKILAEAGLLKRGHVVETDRAGLVGQYIGQTEQMTKAKLEQAVGGILFIDEAYALGNKDSARDYGNDAIETILKFMEDRRDDLVVIVAGYSEPMKLFFNSNPGIRSRFANVLEFPALAGSDAAQVFVEFCEQHQYVFGDGVKEAIEKYFAQAIRRGELVNSNGRGVRTLFEQTIARQSRRVVRGRLHRRADILRIALEDLPWDTGRSRLHIVSDTDK